MVQNNTHIHKWYANTTKWECFHKTNAKIKIKTSGSLTQQFSGNYENSSICMIDKSTDAKMVTFHWEKYFFVRQEENWMCMYRFYASFVLLLLPSFLLTTIECWWPLLFQNTGEFLVNNCIAQASGHVSRYYYYLAYNYARHLMEKTACFVKWKRIGSAIINPRESNKSVRGNSLLVWKIKSVHQITKTRSLHTQSIENFLWWCALCCLQKYFNRLHKVSEMKIITCFRKQNKYKWNFI